jgi:acyl-CoA synthetase (NDP forming)
VQQNEHLDNLDRVFAPRSIAVVGASRSPDKAGYQAVLALAHFGGDVYAVNPRAGEILGRKAFASLTAIGKPVDLVILAVPAAASVDVVREAIECGCGGGLIMSGGFAESGPAGTEIQTALEALCHESGFRLLGPNTAGFVNTQISLMATFASGGDEIHGGNVAIVAQSSGVNFLVGFLLSRIGAGVSCAIGVGNAIDIDVSDALEFLARDTGTRAIALHLEGIPHGRRLYDTLRRVTPAKPVVALAVGREDIGEFAESHTGKLIGSHELRVGALRQAGAVAVSSIEDLAGAAALLALERLAPKREPGIGVLTGQGGAGLIMLDWLMSAHVSVPPLSDATAARIRELLPPMTYLKNPVDTARPEANFPDVLRAVADDEHIDAVIAFALHEPATMRPESFLPALRRDLGKPIVFGTGGPESGIRPQIVSLRRDGIFVTETPERLAQAAIVLSTDSISQWKLAQFTETTVIGEVPRIDETPDEHAAKTLLEAIGIATPRRAACASRHEAVAAFRSLEKPVVAKILSEEIGHKTEAGGVQLDLVDEDEFERALDALDAIPIGGPRRYLIEEMAPAGLELIVGAVRNPSFGPTITVGMGGTLAEALRDTCTRIAPITVEMAHEMLEQLRAAALLDGWRGSPKLDRGALADAVVRVAAVLDLYPDFNEIEINPLRVYPHGVLALDALLRR